MEKLSAKKVTEQTNTTTSKSANEQTSAINAMLDLVQRGVLQLGNSAWFIRTMLWTSTILMPEVPGVG